MCLYIFQSNPHIYAHMYAHHINGQLDIRISHCACMRRYQINECLISTYKHARTCTHTHTRVRARTHTDKSKYVDSSTRRGARINQTGYRCWHQALPSLESITRSPGCAAISFPTYNILLGVPADSSCRPKPRTFPHMLMFRIL